MNDRAAVWLTFMVMFAAATIGRQAILDYQRHVVDATTAHWDGYSCLWAGLTLACLAGGLWSVWKDRDP